MKIPAALLALALAGTAVGQSSPQLPSCAEDCANGFLTNGIGDCGRDPACICRNQSFLGDIACCLDGVCGSEDQTSAVVYASSICAAFGATDLPTAVTCSTASPPATTTGDSAATTSGTGSGTDTTPAPTGTGGDAANTDAAETTTSTNLGPRPTAAAGLGAIGGIIAAVAML